MLKPDRLLQAGTSNLRLMQSIARYNLDCGTIRIMSWATLIFAWAQAMLERF